MREGNITGKETTQGKVIPFKNYLVTHNIKN